MTIHVAKRVKGLVYGRYAVLSQVWNHPFNRGSRLKAIRDYFLWNAVRYSMDARHVLKLPGELEIILGKKENYGSAVYAHGLSDPSELLFLAHLMRPGDLFAADADADGYRPAMSVEERAAHLRGRQLTKCRDAPPTMLQRRNDGADEARRMEPSSVRSRRN